MEHDMNAIQIHGLAKMYKLYNRQFDRVKDAFGLSKHPYQEHYALRNIDFEVKKGETVGIIGTNGSGKSTLLKIITGVLSETAGSVHVNGRISALLELGAGFNMEYTGIENIYLNGTMMGFSDKEIDEKLQDILDFADIGEFVYQPVKTYSSGMFVRLAFAVSINIEPEILIVDEALSVGDVFFQAKCYHKFEEFKEKGKTILFVSHDLSSISKYCDRVMLLNKGQKIGEGSPKEMIDVYKQVLAGQYQFQEEDMPGDMNTKELEKNGLSYGTKQAEIVDLYILDSRGNRSGTLIKSSEFTVCMEVQFHESIQAPIFAYSLKNAKGIEITGTNTMFERAFLEPVEAGKTKQIMFKQVMRLQGGDYLLSAGLTGYEGNDFVVYHRLYDAVDFTVISNKDTVGYFDPEAQIEVKDVGKKNGKIIDYSERAQ